MSRDSQLFWTLALTLTIWASIVIWGLVVLLRLTSKPGVKQIDLSQPQIRLLSVEGKSGHYLVVIQEQDGYRVHMRITSDYLTVCQTRFLPPDPQFLFQVKTEFVQENDLKRLV